MTAETELLSELHSSTEAIRFVAADGQPTPLGRAHGIDFDLARTLYRDMVLARSLDNAALALQRQGELGLWLMSLGQEAAQVGSVRALRSSDFVFPSYRDHAAALCRGITPKMLLAQWRGVSHAGWEPSHYNFHFYSLVLGTQTLHATGYAMGVKYERSDDVVLTYFGDGATSQGDVNEALNWAATSRLPVVFFCQNNQWAISTPTSAQHANPLHKRAEGFGLKSYHVDGNDALAVHAVTLEAAAHARSGAGPAFIEAETFRFAGHSTADDPGRYRSDADVEMWKERDPVKRLKCLLVDNGTPEDYFEETERQARDVADATRAACHSFQDPDLIDLFDNVYADPHRLMTEQKSFLSGFRTSLAEEVL